MTSVLNSCTSCLGEQLCIEVIEDPSEIMIACLNCGNHIKITARLIEGFDEGAWKNFETRDSMYKRLVPVFSVWNNLTDRGQKIWEMDRKITERSKPRLVL